MAITKFHARLVWEGGEEDDRRAHRVELPSQILAASSAPSFGGDPSKADPEEMLVRRPLLLPHALVHRATPASEGFKVASYRTPPRRPWTTTASTRGGAAARGRVEGRRAPTRRRYAEAPPRSRTRRCFISNSVNFPVEVKYE